MIWYACDGCLWSGCIMINDANSNMEDTLPKHKLSRTILPRLVLIFTSNLGPRPQPTLIPSAAYRKSLETSIITHPLQHPPSLGPKADLTPLHPLNAFSPFHHYCQQLTTFSAQLIPLYLYHFHPPTARLSVTYPSKH